MCVCNYLYIYIYRISERLTFLSSTISELGFRSWCPAPKPNKNRASSASERPKPFGGFLSPGGSRRSMPFNATTGGSFKQKKRKTNLSLTSIDHGCLHDLTHCDSGDGRSALAREFHALEMLRGGVRIHEALHNVNILASSPCDPRG